MLNRAVQDVIVSTLLNFPGQPASKVPWTEVHPALYKAVDKNGAVAKGWYSSVPIMCGLLKIICLMKA